MVHFYYCSGGNVVRWWLVALGLLLGLAGPAGAQPSCLLVPVPLAERLARAPWVVEAQVGAPQVLRDRRGHLLSRHHLTVFRVFREPGGGAALPAAVLLAGGQLGQRREVVSGAPQLTAGQQGVFFLEPDPQHPGEWRLFAGPQGLIRYNLAQHAAADPFAAYAAIETALYPALRNPAQAGGYRLVQANAALAAPRPVRRGAATAAALAAVVGFTPAFITAGTGAVLAITGSGFGAVRGSGTVQFRNADDGGASRVRPLDADYVSWTDTEIKVRVPSVTLEGSPAGSGPVTVTTAAGDVSTSAAALDIRYSIINLDFELSPGTPPVPLRPKLINANGAGGYTLTFAPSFQQNTVPNRAARTAFERANAQWSCQTAANRTTTTTPPPVPISASDPDGVSSITFDTTPATLPAGVLGITYSYYRICGQNTTVPEVDFVFANRADWNFGDHALTAAEYDFESVALHELGHGLQLDHVIKPAAVMHFSIGNGQSKRTLGTSDDQAGGRAEVTFSTTSNSPACGPAPAPHVAQTATGASCAGTPLPVELVSFTARYDEVGRSTLLRWATATERNSAYFAVEARDEGAPAWTEVLRRPAAGTSLSLRSYEAPDPRPLAGTRYYRLRQADVDGRAYYSPVAVVTGSEVDQPALYPNPVTDQLQVSGLRREGWLVLHDLLGREAARFRLAPGRNRLDVRGLPAGSYQATWSDGQTEQRARVQKL